MTTSVRIGMAGLDTSHVPAFASLLHDPNHEYHVAGGRIVAAFPGGSPDFDLSISRVEKFTAQLRDTHRVEIVESLAALRGKCDAVMLESIDGRVHLEQFREVAEWGVPVFIDKPLAISRADASEIARIAETTGTRVVSTSALRFAEQLQAALQEGAGPITGADVYGPAMFQDLCPGYFWYGIHTADMLFNIMGTGCEEVQAIRNASHDIIVGRWKDGRLGTIRGNRIGSNAFGGTIHSKERSRAFDIGKGTKPFYASLLEKVILFFHGQASPVSLDETLEVISFLEAANRSTAHGGWERLCTNAAV